MKVPISEIIDRISILKLKIENLNNPLFNEELEECEKALENFREEGIEIKLDWIDELYEINKYQWGLESSLKKLREEKSDFEEMGKIYIELQISNKKRVAVKNKISEETKSGFKEIEVN